MKQNWIFWLIRIVIYGAVAAFLIWQYNENKNSSYQDTIVVIGEFFGVAVIFIEVLLLVRKYKRKKQPPSDK